MIWKRPDSRRPKSERILADLNRYRSRTRNSDVAFRACQLATQESGSLDRHPDLLTPNRLAMAITGFGSRSKPVVKAAPGPIPWPVRQQQDRSLLFAEAVAKTGRNAESPTAPADDFWRGNALKQI